MTDNCKKTNPNKPKMNLGVLCALCGKKIGNLKQEIIKMNSKLTILLLVAGGCWLVAVSGCQVPQQNTSDAPFPETMVGIWQMQESEQTQANWLIKIEEGGSIRRVEHYMAGRVDLDKGGIEFEGKDDSHFLFVFEKSKAGYDPEKNAIRISIKVPYYKMELPAGVLEGNLEDIFEGTVSADGRIWKAIWINRGQLDGAVHVPDELTEKYAKDVVFEKIELPVQ